MTTLRSTDLVPTSTVVWFRDDLRLIDHPALQAALERQAPIVCVYILEDDLERPLGGAARWFLHHALQALNADLKTLGNRLILRRGSAAAALTKCVHESGAQAVFWNRRYGARERGIDAGIKESLQASGIEAQSVNGHLLYEPWTVQNKTGSFFKVFTPFWRAAREIGLPAKPLLRPTLLPSSVDIPSESLDSWRLFPTAPDWSGGMQASWDVGESAAQQRWRSFLDHGLSGYATLRDRLDLPHTSKLSPDLRFGTISVRQLWWDLAALEQTKDIEKFQAELGWREFSYHLLYHFPNLATKNFQDRFDAFPWQKNEAFLQAWQRGQTGYPVVDAAMRQLWQTGWMHNRARMIVASVLVKHFLQDWRLGEAWFWDTLVDADPASNSASWQWVAGSGADAAPYFRIFNPILQGEKFDPDGAYVRQFVPELAKLSKTFLHRPWTAPPAVLQSAGIVLGETYPQPIVAHEVGRDRALRAFDALKSREN
jgi:deoxyribodipyrimidine photo-lyase